MSVLRNPRSQRLVSTSDLIVRSDMHGRSNLATGQLPRFNPAVAGDLTRYGHTCLQINALRRESKVTSVGRTHGWHANVCQICQQLRQELPKCVSDLCKGSTCSNACHGLWLELPNLD